MWTAVGLKTLTCGACLPTRESWGYGHKRGSRAHAGMAMVVVILVCCARWKAFLPSCPATSLCARATRVLGLRRPRITFGARGSDGALVAGTGVAARHAAMPRVHVWRGDTGIAAGGRCHARMLGLSRVCSNGALREPAPRRLPVVCAMAPPSVRHGRPSFLPALIGSRRTRDRTSTGLSCCCLCGASRCWCCR